MDRYGYVCREKAKSYQLLTPENVMGPFYPLDKPLEKDADLTTLCGHKQRVAGKVVHLMGRVLNLKGEPVRGVKMELWQANSHGKYAHPADTHDAPLDPNFQGYAVQKTDKEGRYRFKGSKLEYFRGILSPLVPRRERKHLITQLMSSFGDAPDRKRVLARHVGLGGIRCLHVRRRDPVAQRH
jgi:protocatechuate 3,4-dioxygenase beta subunit